MQKLILLIVAMLITMATQAQDISRRVPAADSASPRRDSGRTLDRVTITGHKPPVEHLLDKTVINLDQRITAQGTTVLEAMQHLPGVQVTPDGQMSINGRSGVNVYLDGKPTYLSAEDLASLLNSMAASSVQRIEIMTNPPARYEASGTAGIINIVRKTNHNYGFNGSINGSFIAGHFIRYNGGITAGYKNSHFNFLFNDSYTYSKTLFQRNVTSDLLDLNQSLLTEQHSVNSNITLRQTHRPTATIDVYLSPLTTVSLSATGCAGSQQDRTVSSLDVSDSHRIPISHEDFISTRPDHPYNYTTTLQLTHRLDSADHQLTIDLDYADFVNKPQQTNRVDGEIDAWLLQHRRLQIYSAQIDLKKAYLETGFRSSYVKISNDNSYIDVINGANLFDTAQSDYSTNTERIDAAYATFQKTGKKLQVQTGLRIENSTNIENDAWKKQYLTQHYLQLFPTLFLNYKINTMNSFLLRLGRRTERPDYSEMIPFRRPLTPTLYFQGNPNLRPHLSWHGELTWSWRNQLTITVASDLDHDYMQTLPYVDPGDTTITRRPTNVQARSWNVDLTWSKQLFNWWSIDNTVSFYRNAFSASPDNYWPADPGMISAYLNINNSFHVSGYWTLEMDGEYDSRRRLITSRFGSYYLVNFAVRRSVEQGRGAITLNVHNIFQSEGHNVIDRYTGLYQYANVYFHTRYVSLNLLYRLGTGKLSKTSIHSSSEEEQSRAGN